MASAIDINGDEWEMYGPDGTLLEKGVQVRQYGDGTVRIGLMLRRVEELNVSDDGGRIEPRLAKWHLRRGQ